MVLKYPTSQKTIKKATSASSITEECDVFNDALENENCRGTLLNCLVDYTKFSWSEQTGADQKQTVACWSFKVSQIHHW